ncbi:hypothetical protein F2P81_010374 [Scophthalmus maximus]|uniref:Uncharacterized protein n=1 Tax=Scophthalmus maximus TaxID=52904 RepID=A0A6A4T0H4_SCOMX|nr:hypothetical protein F2P81_010374 [Scophthalmus maximus]
MNSWALRRPLRHLHSHYSNMRSAGENMEIEAFSGIYCCGPIEQETGRNVMEVRGSSITMALVDKPQPHEKARLGEVFRGRSTDKLKARMKCVTATCSRTTDGPPSQTLRRDDREEEMRVFTCEPNLLTWSVDVSMEAALLWDS